jgi:hypothetical protein
MPAGRVCAAVRPTYTESGTKKTGITLPVGIVGGVLSRLPSYFGR